MSRLMSAPMKIASPQITNQSSAAADILGKRKATGCVAYAEKLPLPNCLAFEIGAARPLGMTQSPDGRQWCLSERKKHGHSSDPPQFALRARIRVVIAVALEKI